ncbi:hypothetical protein HanPI659440_Chr03g0118151 [Helianthus annuus]|nr:hypothetical protein HanPI659440_Chr03g0118151 [Helianthus annuus]
MESMWGNGKGSLGHALFKSIVILRRAPGSGSWIILRILILTIVLFGFNVVL